LGLLYENVYQDYAKAREWYEKAAAKDNAVAMRNLGALYEHGEGVPQDYAKAREWYEKAFSAEVSLERRLIEMAFKTGRYAEALQRTGTFRGETVTEETKRRGEKRQKKRAKHKS